MKPIIKAVEFFEVSFKKIKKTLLHSTDQQYRELERWYAEDPFDLKRSEFEFLTPNSVVFDLGGYVGQWSSDIAARYNSRIYIFEPVKQYAQIIRDRFLRNEKVVVVTKGLAPKNGTAMITIDKFASRVTDKEVSKSSEQIELEEFNQFTQQNGIKQIDLVKINIEGAEYDLMEYLVATNTISSIHTILIQFHNFVPDHETRRKKIQENLQRTHRKVFDYPYVWELWTK